MKLPTLLFCIALCGCHKPTEGTIRASKDPAPGPAPAPATAALPAAITVKKISVVQEGTAQGIVARINRITADDKRLYFALTNDKGVAEPNQPCAPGDRFMAEPTVPAYLSISDRTCSEVIEFPMPSTHATYALVLLGDESMKAGDFTKAQLYYTSAATRLKPGNAAEALLVENQARIALGRSLGFSDPTVRLNGEEVFTTAVAERIEQIQAANRIARTGKLDPLTAEAISGLRQADALRAAEAVPKVRVEAYKIDPATIPHGGAMLEDKQVPRIEIAKHPRYDLKAMTRLEHGKELGAKGHIPKDFAAKGAAK